MLHDKEFNSITSDFKWGLLCICNSLLTLYSMATIDRLRLTQFGNLELLAKQVVEGFITGMHKSPFHGFSVEFAEHRAYNEGESVKNIDWKLFARTDKYFVKQFEEETNLRCHLLLDVSPSMYYPDDSKAKIRFAQSKAKRERKIKIALKTPSSMSTLNGRARKLAVKIIKQRLARKPLNKLSVSEKERIEKVVQKRKKLINRLAMKLVSRVKKIEQTRLHRGK